MRNEKTKLPTIHHLIRYFFLLGMIVSVAYVKNFQSDYFLPLIGPALYVAYQLKNLIVSYIWPLPSTNLVNDYFFTVPITILYFTLVGIFLKQLINERGKVRFLSLLALISFLAFIHYTAWQNLTGYFSPPVPTSPENQTE